MKSPPFAYARAESAEEALELLAEGGDDAKVLAGGQSLLPLLAYRFARPTHLVDVSALGALTQYRGADGELVLDALVRHAALERMQFAGANGLLSEAAACIGHLPIRMRGTLGGSLAHADPAAELPLAALALDAEMLVRSADEERRVPAAAFFHGPFTTAVDQGALLTALVVPQQPPGARAAFAEFAVRAGDFALVSAAVVIARAEGQVEHVRIVLGGVEATPFRASDAESVVAGETASADAIAAAAAAAAAECDPGTDQHAGAGYRRRLVAVLVRQCLERACHGGAE
jgi:carbon-monoxide dehydrogenase medium subunit/6-hydroxypseudooxynicotine dehydrogenase subunit alpha